ncbi:MAG: sulfatase-like hydrolase/transferase [Acidobacteria bacterium]|nr:sulfatase-like hydrolase/transferase [Acidobacteriota bacterium]
MNRRQFLSALAFPPLAAATPKPNIVLILADDLGYADIGAYGCKDVPTPNIDSVARNGVRFTGAYVSCPYCSPTRAGIMTGRYQTHFGHEFNPGPAEQAVENFGLPLTETAMPQRLKDLGYKTGMFGKWHLGYRPAYHPQQRGFDEFFGFLGGAHSYIDAEVDPANPILRGTDRVAKVEYTTDQFAAEAAGFIDRNKGNPFFLYVPFNAVHNPAQALPKYEDRFKGKIADPARKTFAAMLSALDDGVGLILKTLEKHKLTNNTLLVFLTDNGGPTAANTSKNDPLRGFKAQVYEGGIRIPFMMQWPGHVPKGKVYANPIIALDLLPTFVAAAGGTADASWKLDGADLLPFIAGKNKGRPHERLYWRFGQQWAIREGDWKLMSMGGPPALYNLKDDIGEARDLSNVETARVEKMGNEWETWNKRNMPPLWIPAAAPGQKKQKKKKAKA